MSKITYRESVRRFRAYIAPLTVAYVAMVVTGPFVVAMFEPKPPLLLATVAALSAVPLLATLWIMLRHFDKTDEYVRLRQLKAFAEGSALTLSVIIVLGFLQLYQVLPPVNVLMFGLVFFGFYGICYFSRNGWQS